MSDRPRQNRRRPRTHPIRDVLERSHIQARIIQLETTILNTSRRNIKIIHIRRHITRERQNLTPLPRLRNPISLPRHLNHKSDDIARHRTLIPDIPITRPLTRIQLNIRQRHPSIIVTKVPLTINRGNRLNPIDRINRVQLIPIMHLNRTINLDLRSHIGRNTSRNPGQNQTIDLRIRNTGRPRLQPSTRSLTMRQTRIINGDHDLIITRRIRHIHSHRLRNRISVRARLIPRSHGTAVRLNGDSQPVNRHQRVRTAIPNTLNATERRTLRHEQEWINNMPIIIGSIRRRTVQHGQRMQNNITHKSFLTINHSDVDTPILPTKEDRRETSSLSSSTSSIAC